MKTNINQQDEQRVMDSLNALDLSPIKAKLAYSKGWSVEYSTEVEKWYKRFLFISYKFRGKPIVVNDVIDEFWHNHILDTRKYSDDCHKVFGNYLHHFPYFGMRGAQDRIELQNAFEETNRLFLTEFGETEMKTAKAIDETSSSENDIKFFQAAACSDCSSFYENGEESTVFNFERPTV